MKLNNLSDKALSEFASSIDEESKRRAQVKIAASAVIAILKKHGISPKELISSDIWKKNFATRPNNKVKKRSAKSKVKMSPKSSGDKRKNVAYKFKNSDGPEKWTGRGRAPVWVTKILGEEDISLQEFKNSSRFKL